MSIFVESIVDTAQEMGIGREVVGVIAGALSSVSEDVAESIFYAGDDFLIRIGSLTDSVEKVSVRLFLTTQVLEEKSWEIFDWRYELGETPEFYRTIGAFALSCVAEAGHRIPPSARPVFA